MVRLQVEVELSDRQWDTIERDRGTAPRDRYLADLLRGAVNHIGRDTPFDADRGPSSPTAYSGLSVTEGEGP